MNPPTTPPANSEAVQAALNCFCDRSIMVDGHIISARVIISEELKLLRAALAEKEQQVEFLQHTVLALGKEKVAANKRIGELEKAADPLFSGRVLVPKLQLRIEQAEQERDRYRTALEQIADPDCTDYDCPQCGRIVSKHPTGECPSCGFLSQGQIKAALATPGDAAEEQT